MIFEQEKIKECYLDHAGSTLYSEKQIQGVFSDLSKNIYANPHAKNLASRLTEDAIDIIRYQILDHFNTNIEEYSVVFTSGTTAALKIIGECFNYGDDGTLAYLENNHTSVLGVRNYAKNLVEIKTEVALRLSSTSTVTDCELDTEESYFSNSLFVYPTQCNFSGTKYPLTWIENIRNGILNSLSPKKTKNWYVSLDCASYVSTNKLDLSKHKPDFVTISFYKMFGYPTGLGALLSTLQRLVAKFETTGSVNNLPTPVRQRNARSTENIAAVRGLFDIFNKISNTLTLKGTRFESVEAVKAKATEVLNQLTEADFQHCFRQ
ncbi:hypothetical protein NQ318_019919 [Aromia moschata]|uniref:Aminotransferase class V domain-containing protein n=1 Tax=Aromia moschata TaxID=1265417 RepID=A0AAV8XJV6_9CUCU|nr:hypothetical protein NQ318_019919 [Aromia moschata]